MTEDKPKNKGGRPPKRKRKRVPKPNGRPRIHTINAKMLLQAEELAGVGLSRAKVAVILGVSETWLLENRKENEELGAALLRGKAKADGIVSQALFKKCQQGDVAAIRWYEMTRTNRSEKQSIEVTGKDGAPVEVQHSVIGMQAKLGSDEERIRALEARRLELAAAKEE